MSRIHLVLLSGGSGTRLWPLSNETRSKQFLKVLRDDAGNPQSMVQRVMGQISEVDADLDVTIATGESQAASIERQVEGAYALVREPERRDTMPAVMLACAHLASVQGAHDGDTVVCMPIDTFADQAYYDRMPDLDAAVRAGAAEIVLLGVKPTYPSEKYGYIVPADTQGAVRPVSRFVEKPGEAEAKKLIGQGALWNCGAFAFRLGYLLDVASGCVPDASFASMREGYSKLPKTSFDYGVVEKADSVAVVPYAGAWKDLGTWNTLAEEMAERASGRVVVEDATCENTHVINETGLPLVVAGVEDAVVVATHDGVLVSSKERSAHIKDLVAQAAESRPMYEKRAWGEYRVLDCRVHEGGAKSLVKELVVSPGRQISYQRHAHRSEVWTVVAGEGEVALDGEVVCVSAGSVVDVPAGALHALRAETELHVIEVQLGGELEERDIERFGGFWS